MGVFSVIEACQGPVQLLLWEHFQGSYNFSRPVIITFPKLRSRSYYTAEVLLEFLFLYDI